MPHFPNLTDAARLRLAKRGIDVEASCDALIAEVRVSPPPLLLHVLGLAPIVEERHINGLAVGGQGSFYEWTRHAA